MKTKLMVVASVMALLLCGAVMVAYAQGPEGGSHHGWGGPGMGFWGRELNLTDPQKAQVKTEFAGVPSLDWDIEAPGVAVAGKTITYRVTVANRGTAPGKAQLRVDLPASLDLKSAKPTASQGFGQNAKGADYGDFAILSFTSAVEVVHN